MTSLLQKPSFECQGLKKISLYQSVSRAEDFQHSNNLSKLSEIKLKILLAVANKPSIQAKEVGEQIHLDRIKALKYLKELVKDSYLTAIQLPAQNEAMRGAYCFTLASEISQSDILAIISAKQADGIDSLNKQQLQGFLRKELDKNGSEALLYLCDHPQSNAPQIIEGTQLTLQPKSLQYKLSLYSKKLGLLCCEKLVTEENKKINHYSIAKNLPSDLIKEILLSDFPLEDSYQKQPRQMISADEFIERVEELEYHRSQVAKLEKEICKGGERTTDKISPLWSDIANLQNN